MLKPGQMRKQGLWTNIPRADDGSVASQHLALDHKVQSRWYLGQWAHE
jgi:hypothetical protein